ncbi:MAG: response regulator [Candidatus Kapaibacteriota bacterium]|jgi:response regulator RpfG family c-di-GMP phosphodiesterase
MLKIKKSETNSTSLETTTSNDKKLLVVDDEPDILLLLNSLFSPHFHVRTAESGQQALDILRDGYAPQVIVVEQRMPGMTGAQFLGESRKILPSAIRVTLTSYTDIKEIIDNVNNDAIYRFVGKPWEDSEILETIRLCFEQYNLSTKNAEPEAALERVSALNIEKNDIRGNVYRQIAVSLNGQE